MARRQELLLVGVSKQRRRHDACGRVPLVTLARGGQDTGWWADLLWVADPIYFHPSSVAQLVVSSPSHRRAELPRAGDPATEEGRRPACHARRRRKPSSTSFSDLPSERPRRELALQAERALSIRQDEPGRLSLDNKKKNREIGFLIIEHWK